VVQDSKDAPLVSESDIGCDATAKQIGVIWFSESSRPIYRRSDMANALADRGRDKFRTQGP
jgi:hypothetical protein